MKTSILNSNSEMDAGDHFKNGASPKSQTSRRNILKTFFYLAAVAIMMTSCEDPPSPDFRVTGVTLTRNNATVPQGETLTLAVGGTLTLIPKVEPENAVNKQVSWKSNTPAVADVTDGIVSGLTEGSAIITVTTEDGNKTASCIVKVTTNTVAVTGVTLNYNNKALTQGETIPLKVGATLSLVPTVAPDNATNKNVSWNSNAPGVATVVNGVVTGVAAGSATITVTTQDGAKTASCIVTVTDSGDKHSLNVTPVELSLETQSGSKTIQIEANVSWTVTSDQSWCTVSPASGTGNRAVTVTVTANPDPIDRIAVLNISDAESGLSKLVTVTQKGKEPQIDIYVCGRNKDGYATYWKNGVAFVNQNLKGEYIDIAISGGDVYTIANEDSELYSSIPSDYYYKNNVASKELGNGYARWYTSIAVSNGNVYVAGYDYDLSSKMYNAKYWKNGVESTLPGSNSRPHSIAVSGDLFYVGGIKTNSNSTNVVYWRNGVLTSLEEGTNSIYINSIVISGSDVYKAGQFQNGAAYWKNADRVPLSWTGTSLAQSTCITVSPNGDVHLAGYYDPNAPKVKYWKNGVETTLGNGRASSIAVNGNDVYMTVASGSAYKLWKNGQETSFENGAIARKVVAAINGNSGGSGDGSNDTGGGNGGGGGNVGGGGNGGGGSVNPAVCSAIQNNYNDAKRQRDEAQRKYNEAVARGNFTTAAGYSAQISVYDGLMQNFQKMARDNGCTLIL